MLRIRYKNRQTVFEYTCKRHEVKAQIASHLQHWKSEMVGEPPVVVPIPVADVIAEWVEGETVEPIPVG